MDLALGAMGFLLPKLGKLLKEEYKMQTSVKRDIQAFSRELGSMRAALHRVAEVPRDQLDEEVKLWAGDVRELSYDMEDVVDSLLVRVKGSGAEADMDGFKELVSKMKNLFKKGKARRQIATAIKDIKEQVQDVADRHERYKADGVFSHLAAATKITAVDPLLVALYEDKQRLVGIENTRDELIEKLRLTDDDESKQPKILSIVGFGGLGKTTLAKAIYDKVESEFDCAAFVSVSRSPDIKKVFKDLLFEVDRRKYMSLGGATLDEKQLISLLQESLRKKSPAPLRWPRRRPATPPQSSLSLSSTSTSSMQDSITSVSSLTGLPCQSRPCTVRSPPTPLQSSHVGPCPYLSSRAGPCPYGSSCAGSRPLSVAVVAQPYPALAVGSSLQRRSTRRWYLIVVDDIWDVSSWKTIKYALTGSKCGSRIITTSRSVSVSRECCSYDDDMVYNMQPLSDGDSKRLFYNRIFSRNNVCPTELQQVSMNILKKCAGIPLAIITLASHLASNQQIKPISQWYALLNSIGTGLTKGDTNLEEMRRILSFSYYDLPSHLKTCLLYLSVFPEDYEIDRNRLIRRWIAEGFIQGDNLFELGVSYFNDLVNRSMIQVSKSDYYGEPIRCRVHDMMLDLICDLASEENFVTIMDFIKVDTPFETKVRRLSVQKVDLANTRLATSSISQVRSFTVFSPAINQMLPLPRFQVLRVLDLEDCDLGGTSGHLNLSCVGSLLHLRYLGLSKTKLRKIPKEIGKLLFLQTLDLEGVHKDAKELPASVVQLRNLMYLYVSRGTYLPIGYKKLTSLQELTHPKFTEDGYPEELGYLTELRVLKFCLPSRYPPEKLLILLESLGKLHKLQSLFISADDREKIGNLGDWVPSPPQLLCHLSLQGWYQAMPTVISYLSLPLLSYLHIYVHQVRLEDIQVLGTLPALRHLYLQSDDVAVDTATEQERETERSFMLRADAFPRVIRCRFLDVLFAPHMFPRGAMPMVKDLRFGLLVSDILSNGEWDLCLRNLPSLNRVWIKLHGEDNKSDRYYEARTAVETAGDNHPNRPFLRIWKF